MPRRLHNYMYPLSDMELRAFRSFYHTKFGDSLHYTTDTFIQQVFLEFSDITTDHDDGTANAQTNITLDICAACEDTHSVLRQQRALTKQIADSLVPCGECRQTGIQWTTGLVCPKCGGTGKRAKRKRES